jgi:cell division septation protein DedD
MAGRAGISLLLALGMGVAGCADGTGPLGFLGAGGAGGEGEAAAEAPSGTTTRIVERDVEAPQVFQVEEPGLWDGRPSLGGVWVAYPGVSDPERVIIRNPANGRFVIGALFRRERDNPGPQLQVSSDAAAALGLLAGQPGRLNVTALRREEAPEPAPAPAAPVLDTAETISTETIDAAPAAGPRLAATAPGTSAEAIASATGGTPAAPADGAARPAAAQPAAAQPAAAQPAAAQPAAARPATPGAAAAKPAAPGGRNLIQIGIFSVEANAERAARQMRDAGTTATVRREASQGKTFWRVLVGPVAADARDATLGRVKGLGYPDAYFVSR